MHIQLVDYALEFDAAGRNFKQNRSCEAHERCISAYRRSHTFSHGLIAALDATEIPQDPVIVPLRKLLAEYANIDP